MASLGGRRQAGLENKMMKRENGDLIEIIIEMQF